MATSFYRRDLRGLILRVVTPKVNVKKRNCSCPRFLPLGTGELGQVRTTGTMVL